MDVFALLDDDHATPGRATSRLYTGFVREHRCVDPATLDAVCYAVQADLSTGLHGVLLADDEWGTCLVGAGQGALRADEPSGLRVLVFDRLDRLHAEGCEAWLAHQEGDAPPAPAGVMNLSAAITRDEFEAAVDRIHRAIRDGETDHVNYTYRLHGQAWGNPVALYRRLRGRQRVAFGALMRLPLAPGDEVEWVLSRSPELFVRHEQGRLEMKGTAACDGGPEAGGETARLPLSVVTRTLTLGPAARDERGRDTGLRPLTLGVGGGIGHDTVASDAFEEMLWKARFLTTLDPGLELFETMRATRAKGVAHRARHRERLATSARVLGFPFDEEAFDALLDRSLAHLPPARPADQPWRVRVALRHDGEFVLTQTTLVALPPGPVRLLLARSPLPAARPLARHKTSWRAEYDQGVRQAEAAGAFDTLFYGEEGELLEGGRSNVFLRLDGRWRTPPLADGVLPGVMRSVLLDDPAWGASEGRLTLADLGRAEAVVVCNALRGAMPATVVEAVQPVQV